MNKAQLVESVAKEIGSSKADAARVVDAVIGALSKGLKKDRDVQLVGFGTFRIKQRKARTGRNPQTGEKMKIKASKTASFKPGKALKSML